MYKNYKNRNQQIYVLTKSSGFTWNERCEQFALFIIFNKNQSYKGTNYKTKQRLI